MGCKISAPGLEKAIAGTSMYKYNSDDELPDIHELLADDISRVRKMVKFKNEGVGVIASTLGSLEALLVGDSLMIDFLEDGENSCVERVYRRHQQGRCHEVAKRHPHRRREEEKEGVRHYPCLRCESFARCGTVREEVRRSHHSRRDHLPSVRPIQAVDDQVSKREERTTEERCRVSLCA